MSGSSLGSPASFSLPSAVLPGQSIDLSLLLRAPSDAGSYQGYWLFQAPDGKTFGVGPAADQPIWVKVRVAVVPTVTASLTAGPTPSSTTTPTISVTPAVPSTSLPATAIPSSLTYDFAANACSAEWSNGAQALPCPGADGDPAGAVLLLRSAYIEDGSQVSPALLVLPPTSSADSVLQGIYPPLQVQNGDRLRLVVGCEQGAQACSVLFNIGYQDEAGVLHGLWSLGEFHDGRTFTLDYDLSALAGQNVRFILGASSLGSPVGDRAIWAAPRIEHLAIATASATAEPTPTLVPPTETPVSTVTATPTLVLPVQTVTPAAPGGEQGPVSLLQQLIDAIAAFFQQLFGR